MSRRTVKPSRAKRPQARRPAARPKHKEQIHLYCMVTETEGRVSCGPWQIHGAWLNLEGRNLASAVDIATEKLGLVAEHLHREADMQARFDMTPEDFNDRFGRVDS
jgi:hypothetical protein